MGPDAAWESEPLRRLYGSYSGCLALGQTFLAETKAAGELDLDRLESFLEARADLLAEAERRFRVLEKTEPAGTDLVLRRQVVEILEEMTGLENDLSTFLDERLNEIGEAIRHLRRIRPVFQRYSHLGGDRAEPSLITRHE